MKHYKLVMLCVISLCVASVAKAESKKPIQGDSWVTAKTKISLFADKRVKGHEINVETKAGVVMLRGKVDNADAKAAAEEIAKQIDGAASVKNELQIVPREVRAIVARNDKALATLVRKSMKSNKSWSAVGVKVNDGVVSLNGNVDTISDSAMASWNAWVIDGVYSVKNDITVKY